ncbi:MAG: ABC transporter permease subunit [Proteobacteria bacterium]|nr:ABC transporter permease subunit [Pseudomonadota bacterium]MBI3498009.1 ABC transporter permease subunit [Pseudomonadota bacterium]
MTQLDTRRGAAAAGGGVGAFGQARRGGAWWNDAKVRAVLYQLLVLAGLIVLGWWFASNAIDNMRRANITSGFGFLSHEAGFGISETIVPYTPADSYGHALVVGFLNTIKVAVIGCLLTTVLGVLLGVLRLTKNPLLSRLVSGYIEAIRNIPVLLQLFFWYALITQLPGPRQAINPIPGFFLSNRGMQVPALELNPLHKIVAGVLLLGLVATIALYHRARRQQELTGHHSPVLPAALLLLVGVPLLIGYLIGAPLTLEIPELQGFNFAGGLTLSPEFSALLFGLTIYTSAFVAEIVRAGIEAVSKGQWEASAALGLNRRRTLRLVVLPQALRTIIPPITSQYLNYTKNSSLAVAIGYPDLVSVANTTMNQTGQAVECIAIFMTVYLALSLGISAFMNWYNTRVALRER